MPDDIVKVVTSHYTIKVYIRDILHLSIDRPTLAAIYAYLDNNEDYSICLRFANGGKLTAKYEDRALWVDILNKLDEVIP